MSNANILPIDTKEATLEIVGGKGRSLAEMVNAGLAVPGGFYVTTTAYRQYILENNLQQKIIELAKPEIGEFTLSFDKASAAIQNIFMNESISIEMAKEITNAYTAIEGDIPPVAVRSSANAEDLPDMSFAGQQDTYLNIRGEDEIIAAVRNCWASLWTPRAMAYRHQMGIDHEAVAMAVVVQLMVASDVSGILFTANPATGERSEMIINASFGLGEAVVSGQVTPDTYTVDRDTKQATDTIIGAKEQKIVSDGAQGTKLEDIPEDQRNTSSLSEEAIKELVDLAVKAEAHFGGLPQDIEWAYANGRLFMLQSRPITNLPPQPISVEWEPPAPAKILARRQIVENIPDPCTPLFDELYLWEGLETGKDGKKRGSFMVGGGPMFISMHGYAYQRFDWPQVIAARDERQAKEAMTEAEMDAAEIAADAEQFGESGAEFAARDPKSEIGKRLAAEAKQFEGADKEQKDLGLFLESLSDEDKRAFDDWASNSGIDNVAGIVTVPESKNPTFKAFNRTEVNEGQIKEFYDWAKPMIMEAREKWETVDQGNLSDEELFAGVKELSIAGGSFWSGNGGHTFGVAKSTDDQLQAFLREILPDHRFTSGQFLSGFRSKTVEANEHMFEIAQKISESKLLKELVIVTPASRLMQTLIENSSAKEIVEAINGYLELYGHLGYSLDYAEPLPLEDPSGLLATLKTMVSDDGYNPANHQAEATKKREKAMEDILKLLDGLPYWQFRFRIWFTYRFYHIREEVMYYLYMAWPPLRKLALELGQRLTERGSISQKEHIFYLVSEEINQAIEAGESGGAVPELASLAEERFELREARKRLHPPGTVPFDASDDPAVRFKETQFANDPNSNTMMGVPVSPGSVTAATSLINSPAEFDKMRPRTILVCAQTNPAWTPLFAHASGLVTDMGGILGHGSIVAREYGIPAVVGTGTSTQRIKHEQTITVDGDVGTVELHDE